MQIVPVNSTVRLSRSKTIGSASRKSAFAALKPTTHTFCFSASDDRSGEFCAANGRFGAPDPNTSYWSGLARQVTTVTDRFVSVAVDQIVYLHRPVPKFHPRIFMDSKVVDRPQNQCPFWPVIGTAMMGITIRGLAAFLATRLAILRCPGKASASVSR